MHVEIPRAPRRWLRLPALILLLGGLRHGLSEAPARLRSPEGRVHLRGLVEASRCGGSPPQCTLLLSEVTLDGAQLHAPLWVRAASPRPLGSWVEGSGHVEARRISLNPGAAPPWAPARYRWRGRASELRRAAVGADRALPGLRARARQALAGGGREVRALYGALLLGDRSGLPAGLREVFEDAGCAHLLAISGLHLAVVGYGLYRLFCLLITLAPALRLRTRPYAIAAVASGVLIWGYVLLLRPGQATLRAAVAATLVFTTLLLSRDPGSGWILAVAAAALAALDPAAPLGASYQLSFAAACGLILGARPLAAALEAIPWLRGLPDPRWHRPARWALTAWVGSALPWAATAPLTLAWFGQWAPVALLTNLVAVPLTSLVVVPVGFLWLVLGAIHPPWGEALAPLAGLAAAPLLDLVEAWAEVAGPAQGAAWPHLVGLLMTGSLLLGVARRFHLSAGLAALAALVWWLPPPLGADTPRGGSLRVTSLDVGHGDATLLDLPGGARVLVDTGGAAPFHLHRARARGSVGVAAPDPDVRLSRRTLLPALARLGVDALDLLIITHADHDHLGAALHLAGRVPVRELWLPPCDAGLPTLRRLAARVAASGGQVRQVHAGPPFVLSGIRLHLLSPEGARPAAPCGRHRNDQGLVLSVEHAGRRVLLAADIEAPTEARLVRQWAHRQGRGHPLRAEILKVPHHGSRGSSTQAFLDAVAPSVALVSGLPRAGPMPPHQEAVARYQRGGALTWVTGSDGPISVIIEDSGDVRVRRWKP